MDFLRQLVDGYLSRGTSNLAPDDATYLRRLNAWVFVIQIWGPLVVAGLAVKQPLTACVNIGLLITTMGTREWVLRGAQITHARVKKAARLMGGAALVDAVLGSLFNNGIEAAGLWYLSLFPLVMMHLDGVRVAIGWTVAAAVGILVVALAHPFWPYIELEHEPVPLIVTFRFMLLVAIMLSAIAMQKVTDRHLAELHERETLLKQQTEELERSRIEAEAARKAAEEASRAKSMFLANMSHEIRTPMNGLLGMTELLLRSQLNPQQQDFAGTIRSSGETLLTIINDILDFSKIEAGKMTLENVDYDLRRTVEDTALLFGERAQSKGLELCCWVSPDLPEIVRGDPTRLRQVLANLVSNAVKFTSEGEIVVRVDLVTNAQNAESRHIVMSVKDTGIGISSEAQAKLFQAFTQADASTTRRFGGTGLGLSISQQLIDLMEGTIAVTSEPGFGTTVVIEIPLVSRDGAGATRFLDTPDVRRVLGGRRVLVVDDSMTCGWIVRRQLEAAGISVRLAETGVDARTELEALVEAGTAPDAILIDSTLTDVDATKLAAQLASAADLPPGRVLILQPMSDPANPNLTAARDIGCVLAKPVRHLSLLDGVAVALTGQHLPIRRVRLEDELEIDTEALARLRVLLVDDSPVNQRIALAFLRKLRVTAEVANDGRQALERMAEAGQFFDLVLMDCQMPILDGYEATRELRRREQTNGLQRTPVIALTANTLQSDRERCYAAGMDDHLGKPVSLRAMAEKLVHWSTRSDDAKRDGGPA